MEQHWNREPFEEQTDYGNFLNRTIFLYLLFQWDTNKKSRIGISNSKRNGFNCIIKKTEINS